MYYQQGDILIKVIEKIPQKTEKQKTMVVAEGEATGHAHRVQGNSIVAALEAILFIEVIEESKITHEEHLPITLPPGSYEVSTVREYDHFQERARRVVD